MRVLDSVVFAILFTPIVLSFDCVIFEILFATNCVS